MTTTFDVGFRFNTGNLGGLRRAQRTLGDVDRTAQKLQKRDIFGRFTRGSGQAERSISRVERRLQTLERGAKRTSNAFRTLRDVAIGSSVGLIAQNFIRTGIAADTAERRLKSLSTGFDDFASIQRAVAASSERFGQSQTQTSKQLADIYGRLRPLGFELGAITDIFEGFQTLSLIHI